jgi:purine-binding chemotaxis protein CheW
MSKQPKTTDDDEEIQFCCFYLGETLCGLDIRSVQEINDDLAVTPVPLAPDFVVGILNLRGQIITVIDQQMKIGLGKSLSSESSRIIIVRSQNDSVGLLVDRLAEVINIRGSRVSKPPANVKGIQGSFFQGVIHTDRNELLGLLNLETLLQEEPG